MCLLVHAMINLKYYDLISRFESLQTKIIDSVHAPRIRDTITASIVLWHLRSSLKTVEIFFYTIFCSFQMTNLCDWTTPRLSYSIKCRRLFATKISFLIHTMFARVFISHSLLIFISRHDIDGSLSTTTSHRNISSVFEAIENCQ